MEYITLKEVCAELGISLATGRNWVRLGKLVPKRRKKNVPLFLESDVERWKQEIRLADNKVLKSRRNKTYISGNGLYVSYVSEQSKAVETVQELLEKLVAVQEQFREQENINQEESGKVSEQNRTEWLLPALLADCAIKLVIQRCQPEHLEQPAENLLRAFLEGDFLLEEKASLIWALIEDEGSVKRQIEEFPELFQTVYLYEEQEDILGLLYISCKNIGSRKAAGAYYTPTRVVDKLVGQVWRTLEQKEEGSKEEKISEKLLLDPCCGTGNFLLQLPEGILPENIYGYDTDEISVMLARLNMALRFPKLTVETICQNIRVQNFLLAEDGEKYDIILGNPPWGCALEEEEKEQYRNVFRAAVGKRPESYDLFVEKALQQVKKGGIVSFVLPEAVLNVKAHVPIRELLLEGTSIPYVAFLGEVFDKVQCPSVILQMVKTGEPMDSAGMQVEKNGACFEIQEKRRMTSDCFSFGMTDAEYRIFRKISECPETVFLENNADFALGIVTGNNKTYLQSKKRASNEVVLRGQDLHKFRADAGEVYLVYKPEKFQQVAPEKYYRAPEKLLYRFVSAKPVFAYDDKQTLSLNSCNIVIPRIPGVGMKYVLAILNSRVVEFYVQKKFQSIKLLRSHVEQIPIPRAEEEAQAAVIALVEKLLSDCMEEEWERWYEQLEEVIQDLYHLTWEEGQVIKESCEKTS